jgi:hypothetical protein
MNKWKRCEIELTPVLLQKLFEYSKTATPEAINVVMENLKTLSKSDETLTIEEYDHIIKKLV